MELELTSHRAMIRSQGRFWIVEIWRFDGEYFFYFGKNGGLAQLLTNNNTSMDKVYWKKIIPDAGWKLLEQGLKLEFSKWIES